MALAEVTREHELLMMAISAAVALIVGFVIGALTSQAVHQRELKNLPALTDEEISIINAHRHRQNRERLPTLQ